MNWKKSGSFILLKKKSVICGFVGTNSEGYFFAIGKPSQIGGYIAFRCNSEDQAKDYLLTYIL